MNSKDVKKTVMSLRIPNDIKEKAEQKAQQLGISLNAFIIMTLAKEVNDIK